MEPLPWYRVATPVVFTAIVLVLAAFTRSMIFRSMSLGLVAAVVFGVTMDLYEARLCPEYFTVHHNPIPNLDDPTLLGLAWGFLGTWWFGAALGGLAGLCSSVGRYPKLAPRELLPPILVLLFATVTTTIITGVSVQQYAELFAIRLDPAFEATVAAGREHALFTTACRHYAAYLSAGLGGVILLAWIVVERRRRQF